MDYSSKRWKQKRAHILRRDRWADQYAARFGTKVEANVVHHILPAEEFPEYQYTDWNLISVNEQTHKGILHERYTGALSDAGMELAIEVARDHGISLSNTVLVIGLPGSGKSTWVKNNIGGGICYDLDAIAGAFRLSGPHDERHGAARRMAAALRRAWVHAAPNYSRNVFIIRTAPTLDEIAETMPDKLVICTTQHIKQPCSPDEKIRIREAKEWAEANRVPVLEI